MIDGTEIVKIKKTGQWAVIREKFSTPECDLCWLEIDGNPLNEKGMWNLYYWDQLEFEGII